MIRKEQMTAAVLTTRSGRILEIAPEDYRALPQAEAEHCQLCEGCHRYYDRRRLEQVIFHNLLGHNQDDAILADCEKTPDGAAWEE
jgi:hypothetical protein